MSRQEFNEAIKKAMNPEPTPEDLALAVRSSEADVLRGLFWASVYDQIPESAKVKCVDMYGDWQIVLPSEKKAESQESEGGDGECGCPSCTLKRATSRPGIDVHIIRI
jgi:hypothetical protein